MALFSPAGFWKTQCKVSFFEKNQRANVWPAVGFMAGLLGFFLLDRKLGMQVRDFFSVNWYAASPMCVFKTENDGQKNSAMGQYKYGWFLS